MKIIFAIGNPGLRYKYTYHNLGLLLSDYLIKTGKILEKKETTKYVFYKLEKYNLLQSKVYMNVSFEAIREMYCFLKLTPANLLVLHDELSIKKFIFKLKFTHGLGGHNGLRDIAKNIGPNFVKLQIGIDHPKNFASDLTVSDYVLSKLNYEEWEQYFEKGVNLVDEWCSVKE